MESLRTEATKEQNAATSYIASCSFDLIKLPVGLTLLGRMIYDYQEI